MSAVDFGVTEKTILHLESMREEAERATGILGPYCLVGHPATLAYVAKLVADWRRRPVGGDVFGMLLTPAEDLAPEGTLHCVPLVKLVDLVTRMVRHVDNLARLTTRDASEYR